MQKGFAEVKGEGGELGAGGRAASSAGGPRAEHSQGGLSVAKGEQPQAQGFVNRGCEVP